MKRRIKFPLILKNDEEVRTLEELRENFDLEKIIVYYLDEKLQRWLKDRNYTDELDKIEKINKDSNNIGNQLCKIFGVKENIKALNTEKIIKDNGRINKLKQYTDDEKWIPMLDKIVFDQEELNTKLAKKLSLNKKVYLCGELFNINDTKKDIEYIGVNNPNVFIKSYEKEFNADDKKIVFKNVSISSNKRTILKMKKYDTCMIDDKMIDLKSNIDVKYQKTIKREIHSASILFIDKNGNIKTNATRSLCCIPQNTPKIVDIDADLEKGIALDENGKVYQWGDGGYKWEDIPDNLPKIKQVALSYDLAIALGENGKIYHWGVWNSGRIFAGSVTAWGTKEYKKMPKIDSKIIQIDIAGRVVAALDEKGKVYSWGSYDSKAHNIPSNLPPIKKICIKNDGILALDEEGKLHYWGSDYDILNNVSKKLPRIIDINMDEYYPSVLDENGRVHLLSDDDSYNKDLKELPNLISLYGYGGISEDGKYYGEYRYYIEGMEIMKPIR